MIFTIFTFNMEIYYGGYCVIETPEIRMGKYAKDFGTGFYCTEMKEQAIRWARRYDTPEALTCLSYIKSEEVKV